MVTEPIQQNVAGPDSPPRFWSEEPSKRPGRRRIRARIGGLHCSLCTGTIEKALGRRPGVDKVAVSLTDEKAGIQIEPSGGRGGELLKTMKGNGFTGFDPGNGRPVEGEARGLGAGAGGV